MKNILKTVSYMAMTSALVVSFGALPAMAQTFSAKGVQGIDTSGTGFITNLLSTVDSRVDVVSGRVDTLNDVTDQLRIDVDQNGVDIDQNGVDIDGLQTQINGLDSRVSLLEGAATSGTGGTTGATGTTGTSGTSGTSGTTTSSTTSDFTFTNEDFAALASMVQGLGQRLTDLENIINSPIALSYINTTYVRVSGLPGGLYDRECPTGKSITKVEYDDKNDDHIRGMYCSALQLRINGLSVSSAPTVISSSAPTTPITIGGTTIDFSTFNFSIQ